MRAKQGAGIPSLALAVAAGLCSCGGGNGGNVSGVSSLVLVHSFGNDPVPASLSRGSDGNIYGVATTGGANGEYVKKVFGEGFVTVFAPNEAGTLERITPTGDDTILWNFGNNSTDGLNPLSIVEGRDGNFYGTTLGGGLYGADGINPGGTIFRMSPTGVETVLWSFGNDPARSVVPGSLVQATDGNLYGVTTLGGVSRNLNGAYYWSGSVFKLTPQGVMTELWNFSNDGDGAVPTTLIQGADGNLYGTTMYGGAYTYGTVFRITLDGTETVLWSFCGGTDGCSPNALSQGADGYFYGTTGAGGSHRFGTVFRLSSAGMLTKLLDFGPDFVNGYYPTGLIEGTDDNFYGTTAGGEGTLFRITPTGIFKTLWSFGNGYDGNTPHGLIEGTDGHLYGITADGGANGAGTLFRF